VLSMPDVELAQVVGIIRGFGASDAAEATAAAEDRVDPQEDLLGERESVTPGAMQAFAVSPLVYDTVEATCKYSNYLSRQEEEMARWRRGGAVVLPADLEYSHALFPAFSAEEIEILKRERPVTLHAASQIQGLTPHTLVYLYNFVTRKQGRRSNANSASASASASTSLM